MTKYNVFAAHFKDFKDNYVIIGGTACEIVMTDLGFSFRSTADIDMIMVAEELSVEFGKAFWQFINDGGYESHKDNTGKNYYRFSKPNNKEEYPAMIELFCKKPIEDYRTGNKTFTPIHISDDIKSLSAIVLNDSYVDVLMDGKQLIDGLTVLGPEHLIIFKARAHIDLKSRKENGELVKTNDIMKHLKDIIRLLSILDIEESKKLVNNISDEIRADLILFLNEVDGRERDYIHGLNTKDVGMNNSDEIISQLKELFQLDSVSS